MNILVAAEYATPASGNFIGSMMDLGLYLRERGDNLSFVFLENKNTLAEDGWTGWLKRAGFKVSLIDVSIPEGEQLKFLKNLIKEDKIDLLHIHFDLFLNFAVHNRDELNVKILVHEHMEFTAGRSRFVQTLKYMRNSFIYRTKHIDIVCVNKYVSRACLGTKHWYLPNGLSLKRNVDKELTREECRKLLGIKNDEQLVMFLGWDLYRKGLDVAVKAVSECRKNGSNVILGIVGLGSRPNVAENGIRYIKEHTIFTGDEDWIHFLPSTENMFAYHRAADVYLSSSRSEAFSYGILEAISQNSSVVVSDIKGTNWCFQYTKSFKYSVEDYLDCSKAIEEAVDAKLQSSNKNMICEKYSIEKWCIGIAKIYQCVFSE